MATPLGDALAAQDNVAVALALRADGVIVPTTTIGELTQVRFYQDPGTASLMMFLFSSVEAYALTEPGNTELAATIMPPTQLADFLKANVGSVESVWFDFAGPHPMKSTPDDLIAALELPRG